MVDARTQSMCSRGQQANLSWAVFIYCGEGFDEEFISGLLGWHFPMVVAWTHRLCSCVQQAILSWALLYGQDSENLPLIVAVDPLLFFWNCFQDLLSCLHSGVSFWTDLGWTSSRYHGSKCYSGSSGCTASKLYLQVLLLIATPLPPGCLGYMLSASKVSCFLLPYPCSPVSHVDQALLLPRCPASKLSYPQALLQSGYSAFRLSCLQGILPQGYSVSMPFSSQVFLALLPPMQLSCLLGFSASRFSYLPGFPVPKLSCLQVILPPGYPASMPSWFPSCPGSPSSSLSCLQVVLPSQ